MISIQWLACPLSLDDYVSELAADRGLWVAPFQRTLPMMMIQQQNGPCDDTK